MDHAETEGEVYVLGWHHSGPYMAVPAPHHKLIQIVLQMGGVIMVAGLYASINSIIEGMFRAGRDCPYCILNASFHRLPGRRLPRSIYVHEHRALI